MKCIESPEGTIRRVKDKEARKVADGFGWRYCPKWKFKDQEGKEYRGERHGMV